MRGARRTVRTVHSGNDPSAANHDKSSQQRTQGQCGEIELSSPSAAGSGGLSRRGLMPVQACPHASLAALTAKLVETRKRHDPRTSGVLVDCLPCWSQHRNACLKLLTRMSWSGFGSLCSEVSRPLPGAGQHSKSRDARISGACGADSDPLQPCDSRLSARNHADRGKTTISKTATGSLAALSMLVHGDAASRDAASDAGHRSCCALTGGPLCIY